MIAAMDRGEEPEFVLFWGHTPGADGAVGPHVLSQWWPASFVRGGKTYATAEHYMMAEKAVLFGDEDALAAIHAADSPREAKALGRGVRGFVRDVWQGACIEIVVRGNVAKFGQNPDVAAFLLGTGDAVLVEASPRDRIWGIGLGDGSPQSRDPRTWRGRNLLGFALMEARERLGHSSQSDVSV